MWNTDTQTVTSNLHTKLFTTKQTSSHRVTEAEHAIITLHCTISQTYIKKRGVDWLTIADVQYLSILYNHTKV